MELVYSNTNALIPVDDLSYLTEFTAIHKKWYKKDPVRCEVEILKYQMLYSFQVPLQDDLFLGRTMEMPLGFTPQVYTDRGGFGYFFDVTKVSENIKENYPDLLKNLTNYWDQFDSVKLTRARYPQKVSELLPRDAWTEEEGIAFPLYRMGGAQLNFKLLISEGISGLINIIGKRKEENPSCSEFYDHALHLLEIFSDTLIVLAEKIGSIACDQSNRLSLIKENLIKISSKAPENLYQGLQLIILYSLFSGAQNYNRMDDILAELYEKDKSSPGSKSEYIIQLFISLFKLMEARKTIYDGRLITGGKGRDNEISADELTLLMLEASERARTVLPQLTLRIYKDQNPALWNKAFDNFKKGWVYPMLYNDEINIPAVAKGFTISKKEAEGYVPFGCGELVISHASFGTPSGILNVQKALEITIKEFSSEDPAEREMNFDDLKSAFKDQLKKHIEVLAVQQKLEYEVAGDISSFLFYSILYDDCLVRGKSIFKGGVRYLGGTLETYGNTNAVDSLMALKHVVFDKKMISLSDLNQILEKNFEDQQDLRQILIRQPKYGNDIDEVDLMYKEIFDFICNTTREQAHKVGLDYYLVVVINNDANTDLGKTTGASADGRKAGESLNNGNAPYHGRDRSGLTSLLNSLSKPDPEIHAGTVQNLKICKSTIRNHTEKIKSLLKAYFNNGGTQIMLTIADKKELERALKEPEKFSNLFVRVGGFSARFIDLRRDVQLEIINRTEY